ncbi:MAG: ABC transporter permease [Bryobacterales bacterium]|nr:ABC transporter permease [Bryobacterales bacterium]
MVMRKWFLLPARAVMAALFVAPMAIVAAYSLLTRGAYGGQGAPWTLENYARLLDPLYAGIAVKSFWIAGVSTAVCLAMGFPLALFIARARSRKALWLGLVTLPFWTSFLVRTYAWMFLLRDTGLVNTLLLGLGVIREPLPLLYNDSAVVLGLVYGYLPFMVLPVYAVLEKMDGALLEAAGDLGARPWEVVWRVVLPLAKPGLAAGGVLVFIPCLGAYLTPDLMGGGKSILIGNVIQNQFTTARDWPFGAALSVVLMAMVMALAWVARRRGGEGGLP